MPTSSRADAGARLDRRRRALAHAALLTGLTTVVTGCAHSLAGGVAPSALLLAAACIATLAVLAPVLGAASSWPRRVVAVALAQVVQHGLYSLPQPTEAPAAAHGHVHHAVETIATPAPSSVVHAHGDMLLAHVLAGALTLVALAVGATIVDAAVRIVRGDRIVRLTTPVAPLGTPEPAPVACARRIALPASTLLRTPAPLRGPPLLVV